MYVWLVRDWEDQSIDSVWSTRELADARQAELGGYYDVNVWKVDMVDGLGEE